MKNHYPKFIYDHPIGEDLFEGKSQDKVAENIISYLNENSESKKRVVGIDGEWGSGKSNVIEIIRKKTKSDFHIFTFDAWGHQEDLTRRTFLEELTDDLIRNKLLSEKWSKKIKEKLATNRVITTQNTPEFNSTLVGFVLLILISPLLKKIIEYIFEKIGSNSSGLLSSIITFGLILIVFLICWIVASKENKPTLGKLFFLYKGQQIKTSKHETITSLEPSVREFQSILHEIISDINKKQKLIYVFDNMDRLPVKKVKEIWSSIHTFFAEVDSNKVDSWVLIPYDEKHICQVFNEKEELNNELTVSYIQKTFSIVFRIAPPILSDWKKYFENKFKEAFNYPPPPQEQLANLFDYLHNDYTIKPRQILDYINNIVVLNKQWGDTIPLRYCGLFTLTKNLILENPVEVILERSFIKSVESIFAGDENLETYISCLVFNVEINKADEVLLRRSIEKTLRGESKLDKLSSHPAFITVLDSCFYNTEVNIVSTIDEFEKLSPDIKNEKGFEKYWKKLTLEFIKDDFSFPQSEKSYKLLFSNLSNNEMRIKLLDVVISQIIKYKEDNESVFVGDKFAQIIDGLNDFFKEQKIELDVLKYCPKQNFIASNFVKFVNECESDYNLYNIECPESDLNDFLIEQLPVEISNYIPFIETTIADFSFTKLLEQIESQVKALTASSPDYQNSLTSLFAVYKLLAVEKPLTAKIPTAQAWAILKPNTNHPNAIDLALSILSDVPQRPTYLAPPQMTNLLNKIDNLEYAASIAEYYIDYGDLIDICISNPTPLLTRIVKSLTFKSHGSSRLAISSIINKYDTIREKLIGEDDDYAIAFLNRIAIWHSYFIETLQENDFNELISIKLIEDCSLIRNILTQTIIEKANNFVLSKTFDEWKEAFNDSENSYLFNLVVSLVSFKSNSFSKLSDDALLAYKESIVEFARQNSIPQDIDNWDIIIDFMDARKLKISYKEIRDIYMYSSEGITSDAMLFFGKGLFALGGLIEKDKIDDVIRKIIIPSINT